MANSNKQYLDLTGLGIFWDKIKENFARKSEALASISHTADASKVTFTTTKVDGTATSFDLAGATSTTAGVMSAADKAKLDTLITAESSFNGIQIGNPGEFEDVVIYQNKSQIGLDYVDIEIDGASKKCIVLKDFASGSTAQSYIDASEFIKDGMIQSVSYDESTKKITIDWNTDSGVEDTVIDLSGLIDTYNAGTGDTYVTITKSTGADGKPVFNVSTTQALADAIADAKKAGTDANAALEAYKVTNDAAVALKADAADVYTKTEVDSTLANYYTKTETDTALNLKANAADVYTKTEVDTALNLKANAADVYTKTEVDKAIADLGDVVVTDELNTALANYYTKTEADNKYQEVMTALTQEEIEAICVFD